MNTSIVDVTIGDMLSHPDDVNGTSKARALNLFKLSESSGDDMNSGEKYSAVIVTPKRCSLLIGTIADGAPIWMTARIVQLVCDESKLSYFGGCRDIKASSYAQAASGASFQTLPEALNMTCRFTIALNCSTLHEMSYLDARLRFFLNAEMYNSHVLALPLFQQHTDQIMIEVLVTLSDAPYLEWRKRLVDVSSDGDRAMTGRTQDVLRRLSVEALSGLYKIWCCLHQSDVLMQLVYLESLDKDFYSTLTGVIGRLRGQLNLVAQMRSVLQKVGGSCWVSMDIAGFWLKKPIVVLTAHLEAKKSRCAPDRLWWLSLLVVHAFGQ